ncbi:MAG: SRPBCC family protein [Acidimicrobiales bacterium]
MDVDVSLEARCSAEELFVWVDDLGRYPQWLDLVPRAEAASAVDGDPGPAWAVDLQARLGPLARSKRLRMVRTVHEPPAAPQDGAHPPAVARFERREHDAREHSAWSLEARVDALGDRSSRLTMHLHYGGGLFGPVVEGLLREEVRCSRPRLLALVE